MSLGSFWSETNVRFLTRAENRLHDCTRILLTPPLLSGVAIQPER